MQLFPQVKVSEECNADRPQEKGIAKLPHVQKGSHRSIKLSWTITDIYVMFMRHIHDDLNYGFSFRMRLTE